jgi:putative transcriptional regulator
MSSSSITPALLVAVPQLQDPHFTRTVTLLLESNEEGSFGIVLNRESEFSLTELCEQTNLLCAREAYVRIGGPVEQERAWVVYGPRAHDETSFRVKEDIWVTGDRNTLGRLAMSDEPFHVFVGYAGLGPGQLEAELNDGSWLLTDNISADILFQAKGDEMWRQVIRGMGLEPGRIGKGGGGLH